MSRRNRSRSSFSPAPDGLAAAATGDFDVVVLDPAKQTRSKEEVDLALKKYLDMNRLALHMVAPGGIFLTCSCTGLVGASSRPRSVPCSITYPAGSLTGGRSRAPVGPTSRAVPAAVPTMAPGE